MQASARPLARLACGRAWRGFEQAIRPSHSSALRRAASAAPAPSSSICLRCSFRAIGTPARYYSTQIPPDNRNSDADPLSAKKAEPDAPAPGPEVEKKPAAGIETTTTSSTNPDPNTKIPQDPFQSDGSSKTYELPSAVDDRRAALERKFSQMMDTLQARALNASQTLNDITGYSSIEEIKLRNAEMEQALSDAHDKVRNARQAYKTSNAQRAATQREVTTLLARKDTWSPVDLERFTELYRADHVLEGEVVASQETLTEAEVEEQSLSQRLNAGILKRYHEEQIWSDRIRRASTWGTWGLMGMNFLLFVILQFVAEPWKRRRLVRGVVAEEKAVLEEVRAQLEGVRAALEKREELAIVEDAAPAVSEVGSGEVTGDASLSATSTAQPDELPHAQPTEEPRLDTPSLEAWKEWLLDPAKWKAGAEDLCSDRQVSLRMRDASMLALEGALAGAAVAGGVALLLFRS